MKDLKFRAQNIQELWNYGLICHDKSKDSDYDWFISNKSGKPYAFGAVERTICQFTGEVDEHGAEIYEHDIFESVYNSLGNFVDTPHLVYENLRWVLKGRNRNFEYLDYYEPDTQLSVIGNMFDNPELLTK